MSEQLWQGNLRAVPVNESDPHAPWPNRLDTYILDEREAVVAECYGRVTGDGVGDSRRVAERIVAAANACRDVPEAALAPGSVARLVEALAACEQWIDAVVQGFRVRDLEPGHPLLRAREALAPFREERQP